MRRGKHLTINLTLASPASSSFRIHCRFPPPSPSRLPTKLKQQTDTMRVIYVKRRIFMFKQAKKLLIPYNTRARRHCHRHRHCHLHLSSCTHILTVHRCMPHLLGQAGKKLIETHARMKPDRAVSAKSSGLCGREIREWDIR